MKITKKLIKTLFAAALVLIFGCNNEGTNEKVSTDKGTEEKHIDEEASETIISAQQVKLMGIESEKLELQNISGYIKVNGEVVINPDQESKVGSIIPGRIKKIYVKEGSYVKAGQTLAVIENPLLIDVQVEYINAKNEYEYSKREYERQLKLNSDNIGSKKTLSELESKYKKSLTDYKTLEEKLSSYKISKNRFDKIYEDTVANLQKYYTISAPISGNVIERNVSVGQYVEPSGDMFHIVNTSTVFVDLNVFEKDLQYVSAGQKVTLEVSVNPYEVYEGEIVYVNKVFDDVKRTVKVRVAINNKREKLLPNMFVSAKIYIKQESVLAVPISAIETDGETKYIFVNMGNSKETDAHNHEGEEHPEGEHSEESEHKETGKEEHGKEEHGHEEPGEQEHKNGIVFKKVIVNIGISDDKFIQIFPLEEIEEGALVVTKGTFYLKSELKKSELGAHEH
ncbi:MAG: efflux RND transporter periplasmic adaptor subunit [Ignavibacteria bacterium]|nr:efflux RND transporter periplasmic adaptor subunit [Ignavibacteria bacterium]